MKNQIARGGKSDYRILIPPGASRKERFAAEELRFFLGESAGISPEIREGEGAAPFISLSAASGGDDGFSVRTEGRNILIRGNSGNGAAYGVYALLFRLIGLEFFAPDVYRMRRGDIDFYPLDFSVSPDIPLRAAGICPVHDETAGDPLLPSALRMGLRGMAEGWGLCNHSYFKILPPATYRDAHPDWYTADGKTLCLTNAEMRREFAARLKEIVAAHPSDRYFMIGQEDNADFCECPACAARRAELGGYRSALMIDFTRAVVREVNGWLERTAAGRQVIFVMFAYQQSVQPPAVLTEEGWRSVYPEKLEDNLAVMLAPLAANGGISYFDRENYISFGKSYRSEAGAYVRDLMLGWRALADKLFFWSYDVDYADTLVPYNCFDALALNYAGYKKYGVYYLFEEGAYARYIPNFNRLRVYLISRLSWRTDADAEACIDRFFGGVYGKGAKDMRVYFDFLRDHLRRVSAVRPAVHIRFDDYPDLGTAGYWSMEMLERALELHAAAVEACGQGRERELAEEEGFPVRYLLLSLYADRLPAARAKAMAKNVTETAKKYGIYGCNEGVKKSALEAVARLAGEKI